MKVHCPIDNQSIVLGRDEEDCYCRINRISLEIWGRRGQSP